MKMIFKMRELKAMFIKLHFRNTAVRLAIHYGPLQSINESVPYTLTLRYTGFMYDV